MTPFCYNVRSGAQRLSAGHGRPRLKLVAAMSCSY